MRILIFNWHEPYFSLLSRVGHEWLVADWHRPWSHAFRPLPGNARLAGDERHARQLVADREFDLVLCQTVSDLAWLGDAAVPVLFLAHNSLPNEARGGAHDETGLRELVSRGLERGGCFAAISQMKRQSWGLDGDVIPPGLEVEEYEPWTGDVPAALTVANLLRERAHMLGYEELAAGLAGTAWTIHGVNPTLAARPAESWEALQAAYRAHRLYAHATLWPWEDGYNLALLEAMATGMPVVTWANPTSPVAEGLNGFVAEDAAMFQHWTRRLLGDHALAARLGRRARQTVAERFRLDAFREGWQRLLERAAAPPRATAGARPPAAVSGGSPVEPGASAGGPPAPAARAADEGRSRGRPGANTRAARERRRIVLATAWTPISTSVYYARALRGHHEVLTWGPSMDAATLAQWQAVTEQHALKPVGSAEEKIHLLRGLSRPADVPAPKGQPSVTALLERLPRGWRPDLFVWIDGGPDFLPLDLGRLDCPTVCLAGDTHAQLDWRLAYARPFSHVFLMFNRQHMAAFRDAGCPRVGWLPAACDPDIHRAFGAAKAWDVVFVGQTLRRWHPDRVRLLERLRAAGFDVHVTTKILEEMALAFSRGRIVFNRSLAGDLNMRVFEALASGSMLLTDRLPPESGLEDLFTDRAHLVCYDEDTLESLARHYLDHPEEREAIARAGHEAVLARHTYGHRVRALLAAVLGTDAGGEMDHDRATERGRSAFGHPPEWAARGGGTAGTTGEARVQEAASGPGDRAGDEALPAYYRNERHEIAALVPAGARRVLDVGCAAGGLGRLLKSRARCEVVGIESHAGAAEAARHHLDQVLVMDLDAAESLPFEAGAFDCVVCADVLEHLRDPERALRLLRRYLAPEGTLVASIPNVRHASVLVPLLVAGRFEYQAEGILDRTHLRFFTLAEIVAMVERTGFRATGAAATKTPEDGAVGALAPVVAGLGGDAERFREESTIVQYLITAALAPEPGRPAAAAPRVTLVIPVHDRADLTARCLEALARTVDPSATEVIVVDNASTDAARDLLARAPLPVRVIENAENAGFGRASNQGARAARGDLLVFLNNDTEPEPGWLEALESAAAEPGVGIVGARLLYPATRRIQHAGLALNPDGIPDHVWRNAREDDPRAGAPRDLDMVTGACLAIRRERFRELGGFDEGYVNGVEDVDLCLTARRAGLRVRYEPRAVVLHNEGSTRGRFAHVAPNLRRLADKWGPTLASMPRLPWSEFGEEPGPTVAWEGSFFLHHSLAGVNRAVCRALLREGVDLTLTPFEVDEVEPRRLPGGPELARLVNRPVKRPPALRVRHRFPPDWEPRPGERLVVIQPWEFGAVPAAWVDAIRRGVEELWVPSEFVRRGFVSGGVPPERVVVIPNGFDPALFHPGVTPLPLPTARRARFLYVGGSIPRKGWDVLLRAYVEEFTADDDVCLIIKDHAYYGHRLDGVLADLRRDPRAPEILYFFESMTPGQLAGLYAAADWLVHPFRGEGFGLPVLEAMACGKPVIVTDAGPVREFCPEGAGLFIPATPVSFPEARIESLPTVGVPTLAEPDRAALRRALRAAYQDPAQARARGQAAAAHVHAHFTWERIGRRYALRIRALLAGGPRPADRTAPEAPAPRSILDGAPADALAALALPAP